VIEGWQRHDLVRVDPLAWRRALMGSPAWADDRVASWADRGWPVVVRRYALHEPRSLIPVAISLPADPRNIGVALQLQPEALLERVTALRLDSAQSCAPRSWQRALAALKQIGDQFDSQPILFGSLLWQRLTGMSYLKQRSDLDLLWRVANRAHALGLAEAIASCEAISPMRIDGELMLPDQSAVHWREYQQQRGEEVLTKSMRGVQSRAWHSLFAHE
jgi:phosphoribosyl-dephospho-CoA transferase